METLPDSYVEAGSGQSERRARGTVTAGYTTEVVLSLGQHIFRGEDYEHVCVLAEGEAVKVQGATSNSHAFAVLHQGYGSRIGKN